jgi:hypothetical protein
MFLLTLQRNIFSPSTECLSAALLNGVTIRHICCVRRATIQDRDCSTENLLHNIHPSFYVDALFHPRLLICRSSGGEHVTTFRRIPIVTLCTSSRRRAVRRACGILFAFEKGNDQEDGQDPM